MAEERSNSDSSEQAMNDVLTAERETRDAVAESRRLAEQQVATAREEAQRILERTTRRIAALRERCSVDTKRRVTELLKQEKQLHEDIAARAASETLLAEAVGAVATRLTTAEHEPESESS